MMRLAFSGQKSRPLPAHVPRYGSEVSASFLGLGCVHQRIPAHTSMSSVEPSLGQRASLRPLSAHSTAPGCEQCSYAYRLRSNSCFLINSPAAHVHITSTD